MTETQIKREETIMNNDFRKSLAKARQEASRILALLNRIEAEMDKDSTTLEDARGMERCANYLSDLRYSINEYVSYKI